MRHGLKKGFIGMMWMACAAAISACSPSPAAEPAASDSTDILAEELEAQAADAEFADYQKNNPLFAVLNPDYIQGAVIGAANAADMATVDKYLALPEVRDCFPADVMFKWAIKGDPHADGRYFLSAIKVERPDGVSNSGWNNFVRNGLDDLTFYIQKNGEAIPLTLSSGEDEDQYPSRRWPESPWHGGKGRAADGEYTLEPAPQRFFGTQ